MSIDEARGSQPVQPYLQQLLGCLPMGVLVAGADGRVQTWNQQAAAILRVEDSGLTGADLVRYFPPAEQPRVQALLAAAHAAPTAGVVVTHPAADGAPHYLEVSAARLALPVGEPGLMVTLQDVTAREVAQRAAAAAQRESAEAHALLDSLLTNAQIGFGFIDTEMRYVRVNKALAAINGPSVEEHLGRRVRDVLPYMGDEAEQVLHAVLTTQQAVSLEGGGPTEPGQERHWLLNYYPVFDGDAALLGVGAVVWEITERILIEHALREDEARLRGHKRVLEAIATGASVPDVLSMLAHFVEEHAEGGHCCLTLLDPDGERIRSIVAPTLDASLGQLRNAAALDAWAKRQGLHTGFRAAILGAGGLLGVLHVFYGTAHTPSPRAHRLFVAVVNQAKIAIERKRLEEGNHRQLQSLIENMADGVVAVDELGRLTVVNPAARRLLDATHLSLDSVSLETADLPACLNKALLLALTGQHPEPHRLRLRCGDTEIAAFVSPVGTELGNHGAIALLHDVTGEVRFMRLQESFVANVSHELRGPLAAVSATLEAIADGVIPAEEQPRYYRALLAEMGRLRRLSHDVVDLTRLDTGVAQLHFSAFDVGDVLGRLQDQWHQRLCNQGVTLQVEPVRLRVWADRDRLEQVVTNLLDNAARFTPAGGTITLTANSSHGEAHIHVCDTGVGIAPGHLPHLWTRFYKVDEARSLQPNSGTGLGLSLVKQLVELMGGQVSVASEPGKGSDFHFTVPLATAVRRRRTSAR